MSDSIIRGEPNVTYVMVPAERIAALEAQVAARDEIIRQQSDNTISKQHYIEALEMSNASFKPRIAALEAQIDAMRPVVQAAMAYMHQSGGGHYIPESLSPWNKLADAVMDYEEKR